MTYTYVFPKYFLRFGGLDGMFFGVQIFLLTRCVWSRLGRLTPEDDRLEPENTGPLEKENHLPNHHFQVRAVNLRGCI